VGPSEALAFVAVVEPGFTRQRKANA